MHYPDPAVLHERGYYPLSLYRLFGPTEESCSTKAERGDPNTGGSVSMRCEQGGGHNVYEGRGVNKITWRASDFQMGVLAVNLINRKFLIDAVPGISPWNGLWGYS